MTAPVDLDDLDNRIVKWCSGRQMPSGTMTIVQQAATELRGARQKLERVERLAVDLVPASLDGMSHTAISNYRAQLLAALRGAA